MLSVSLGSTVPPLTTHRSGNLTFYSGAVSHRSKLLLSPGLSLQTAPADVTTRLLGSLHAYLPHHAIVLRGIGYREQA